MPEEVALATTKRKFYKALDAFASTSQLSLAPPASTTSSTKRPATAIEAFDEARARASKRLRHSTSSSSLPPTVIPAATPTNKTRDANASRDPPNFSPWSHETFLARLKTFSSVSLWHPKPEVISEVQWAKRGWRCVDVNTVGCKGGCERRVVVSMESARKKLVAQEDAENDADDVDSGGDDDETSFEQALAERYRDAIIDGHSPSCLWRETGCKDDIYHLQIVRPAVWQPDLRERFKSVLKISQHTQSIRLRCVDLDASKTLPTPRLLHDLPADIVGPHGSTDQDSTADTSALSIALHGWRGSLESTSALLNCDACFQRIGLWMYQPGYRPSRATSADTDDAANTNTEEDAMAIDLVNLHREHCPWRNPLTQRASGTFRGLNACEILQRVVATFARDHRRRSLERERGQSGNGEEVGDGDEAIEESAVPALSREQVAEQDKERESRLRRLKNMFSIRRRPKSTVGQQARVV